MESRHIPQILNLRRSIINIKKPQNIQIQIHNNSQEKSEAIEQKIREIEQKINPFTNFVAWDLEWLART